MDAKKIESDSESAPKAGPAKFLAQLVCHISCTNPTSVQISNNRDVKLGDYKTKKHHNKDVKDE